jgi:hypothetical protein
MEVLVTPGGTRFVLCGAKPSAPSPTIFVMAGSVDAMVDGGGNLFTEAATDLTRDGWLYVTLDIPCHGADPVEGEPAELSGWAHRVKPARICSDRMTRCSGCSTFCWGVHGP